MTLVLNPQVYPTNGYYFIESDGVKVVGNSFADTVLKMRDYRIRSGRVAGDPIQELNDFTCSRYPTACREIEPGKRKNHLGNSVPHPLVTRVNTWLNSLYRAFSKTPAQFVTKVEAERRAAICRDCPKQARWNSECGSCSDSARRLSFSLRKGQEVPGSDLLKGCDTLGEDTRTSIFLQGLKPETNVELPEYCWRKE